MSGMNRKNAGAEREYDRKVEALWDEKRELIMRIVGSIEEMGTLAAGHRDHLAEIEEGFRKELGELQDKYWKDVGELRSNYEDETEEEKGQFKQRWERMTAQLEGLHWDFLKLVDRERDLWFGEEFKHMVKKTKVSEGMFDEGIGDSVRKAMLGPEGEGGDFFGDSNDGGS